MNLPFRYRENYSRALRCVEEFGKNIRRALQAKPVMVCLCERKRGKPYHAKIISGYLRLFLTDISSFRVASMNIDFISKKRSI